MRPLTSAAIIALGLFAEALPLAAQQDQYPGLALHTGKQIWDAACAACHGADGKGTATTIAGFEKPSTFPDFTRCDQTTSELDVDYKAVVVHGGPFRGFSQIMPSFGEALTDKQIDQVISYLRGFCTNSHWPRGELNMPRALVTEKAYPEDEVAITTGFNAQGAPGVTTSNVYEQRFGVKNEIEVTVPFTFADNDHTWYGGIGDSAIGVKRTLYSSLRKGSILSVDGEIGFPTGSRTHELGTGVTTFETFAAYDQLLPADFFLEFQGGADLPVNTQIAPKGVFWNTVLGENFAQNKGLGRLWSPMVEFLTNKNLDRAPLTPGGGLNPNFAEGTATTWDILPQMEVTISKRQHIRADVGVRVPVSNTAGRQIQVLFYVLWDWQEGKFTEGW